MKLTKIIKLVEGTPLPTNVELDREIEGGCGSDLLSDVLASTHAISLLLTGLCNPQIVCTAAMVVLNKLQSKIGFISVPIQAYMAKQLNIPVGRVYGVITFYSFFTTKPRGKQTIKFCMGTACNVGGTPQLIEKAKQHKVLPANGARPEAYDLDTQDILTELGDIPLTEPAVLRFLREMIESGITQAQTALKVL